MRIKKWRIKMKYILSLFVALGFILPTHASQLNVVFVVDASGSMDATFAGDRSITRMDAAKKALAAVLNKLPLNSNVGILAFPYQGWVYPLAPINKSKLNTAITSIRANGGTPLGRFMRDGANELIKLAKQKKYGVYKLIVVTDGEATDDAITPLTGVGNILSKGILVEAIGVDMDRDHTLATRVPYRSANNPNELFNAVQAVVAESGSGHSEDYEIIASLDPQIAMAAVQALTTPDYLPVGVVPKVDENGNVLVDENGDVIQVDGTNFIWLPFTIIGVLVLACIIFAIFVAYKERF